MIRISAYLAIGFGIFLFFAEMVRNWGDWQWWPFWTVDYVAAGLLIFGGQRALNTGTLRWLTAGWGFASGMAWMSFFGHVQNLRIEALEHTGPVPEDRLTLIIGILFALCLMGFLMALLGKRVDKSG